MPGPADTLTRALVSGSLSPARYALERWASVVDAGSVRPRFGRLAPPDPRSGTLLARDLLVRLNELGPRARARAERLLARPTDGVNDPDTPPGTDVGYSVDEATPVCDPNVCIHYVTTTANAVPVADAAGTIGVPDYVESVAGVIAGVWAFEVDELGYRAPKSDATSSNDGGGPELDVYLTNLGDDGLYGYCTSDDPRLNGGYRHFDFSAYCVLDNDFSPAEFGYRDTTLPLQVTAAHEFFHAVQFAYDLYEDAWFMEATATWIEDELYDTIDDNRQYLATSPLSNPTIALDKSAGLRVYGDWIFFRYLSESLGAGPAVAPDVVREIWLKADGAPGGRDLFSSEAVAAVLNNSTKSGQPWSFAGAFRDFGAWNVAPARFYSEGGAYGPVPIQVFRTLTPGGSPFTSDGSLDHLTHRFIRIGRGRGVHAGARLRVSVSGPPSGTTPSATLVVVADDGSVGLRPIVLNRSGDGAATVGFGSEVRRIVVVLGNGSVRYQDCYDFSGPYACNGGTPRDENQSFSMTARLLQ